MDTFPSFSHARQMETHSTSWHRPFWICAVILRCSEVDGSSQRPNLKPHFQGLILLQPDNSLKFVLTQRHSDPCLQILPPYNFAQIQLTTGIFPLPARSTVKACYWLLSVFKPSMTANIPESSWTYLFLLKLLTLLMCLTYLVVDWSHSTG